MTKVLREHAARLKGSGNAQAELAYALTTPLAMFSGPGSWHPQTSSPAELDEWLARQRHEAQQALVRAHALAPDRSDILWLAATQCGGGEQCRDLQQVMLEVEADNAAAWLHAMAWESQRGDQAAAERAFRQAALATRYDRHQGAGHLALLEAYAAVEMPVECEAPGVQAELRKLFPGRGKVGAADLVGMIAVMATALQSPGFRDLTRRCSERDGAGVDAARRKGCAHILAQMAEAPTLIEQGMALSLLIELAGEGPASAGLRERYRNHHWLLAQQGSGMDSLRIEDMVIDEVGAMQSVLRAQGRWPAPPGWLPEDPTTRSLILTGRLPDSRSRR